MGIQALDTDLCPLGCSGVRTESDLDEVVDDLFAGFVVKRNVFPERIRDRVDRPSHERSLLGLLHRPRLAVEAVSKPVDLRLLEYKHDEQGSVLRAS